MRVDPTMMDSDDIELEIESLQHYMDECARIEQGISTKDTVRMRQLRHELTQRDTTTIAA